MLLLLSAAHAESVTIPVRTRFSELTDWGADPTVVDDVLSGEVVVSDAATGVAYTSSGELLLKQRQARGGGELVFSGDPSGSVRTWAVYLIDANGELLGKEPQVIDVLFGDDGDGTIVARVTADIVVRNVTIKKRGVSSRATDDGTHNLTVTVQGIGLDAAYVGIQELASDGTALTTHADMEAMTVDIYATFQGMALDAVVPLDTWDAVLEGDLTVEGLPVATDGSTTTLTGVRFDVDLFGAPTADVPPALASLCCYIPGAIVVRSKGRRRELVASRVVLDSDDAGVDTYDGAVDLIVDGDARGVEVGAILTATGTGPKPVTDVLVSLDPDDVAVRGVATGTGTFPKEPAAQGVRLMWLRPLSQEGKALDDWRTCTLTPTALTARKGSQTLRWTGECLRDENLLGDVRGVSMSMTSAGAVQLTGEVMGLDVQSTTTIEFQLADTDLGFTALKGAAAVDETTFNLAWSFPTDAVGGTYSLLIEFNGVTTAPESMLLGTGRYAWIETSEVVTQPKEGVSDAVKQAFLEDQKEKIKK